MEEQKNQLELPFYLQELQKHPSYGRMGKLLLPSGNMVVIREQNGNDDDVLSSFGASDLDTAAINRFIAGIILENTFSFSKSKKRVSETEVLNMLLNDKYFILMVSRIFSLGEELEFAWDWKGDTGKIEYSESLLPYVWDYKNPFPEEADEDYFRLRIPPYYGLSEDNLVYVTLASGKKVSYSCLDGNGENYLLKRKPEERTANAPLKARRLSLWNPEDEKYLEVPNFSAFSPKDLSEIRKSVKENDPQFEGTTEIINPSTGETLSVPLVGITDFFYPREI